MTSKPVFKIESQRGVISVTCDRVGFGRYFVADHNEANTVISFFTKWYATDENY